MKYIYIDDDLESGDKVVGFLSQNVQIETKQPAESWEQELKYFEDNSETIDGLILDLKLDDTPLNQDGARACYRGTALAQELRTRQKEGMKSFPIVLFSANEKLKSSLENIGKNLFDLCIDKTSVTVELCELYAKQLFSVANSYAFLRENSNMNEILAIDSQSIDCCFLSDINKFHQGTISAFSQFFIYEVLNKSGILIPEDILAARLGIDIVQSRDWGNLKDILSIAMYKGVFYEGWNRWWMHLIEKWWNEEICANSYLRSTSAIQRVEIIKEKTGLKDLFPATKIEKAESDEFWTICLGHKSALDPIDGLLVDDQDCLYSWQDSRYVSIDAALMRTNINVWHNLSEVEKEHFEAIKNIYKSKRV